MLIVEVLIEYGTTSLNRPFSYAFLGNEKIERGMRVLVPFAMKKIIGFVENVKEVEGDLDTYKISSGYEIKEIISIIDEKPLFNEELLLLAKKVSTYYLSSLISVYQTMLPPSLKPKLSSLGKPKIAYEQLIEVIDSDSSGLTPKQTSLLNDLIGKEPIKKSDIKTTALKGLIEKKKVRVILHEVSRLKLDDIAKEENKVLNEDQETAKNKILSSKNKVFLLEGVTGSGKTEIYMQVSEVMIQQGKGVIMLVPEIALTAKTIRQFQARFDSLAVFHSDLSDGEKYDEYRKIANGEVKLVIGARSAIFAPIQNLGLIIIDEEHSDTYKQDHQPYYNAIKVALMRSEIVGAKVVLGSATPTIETRIRAMRGLYEHIRLYRRINEHELPKTEIVDMLDSRNIDRESVIFSKLLREKIKDRLEKKEQTILLVNRRGYSTYIACRKCGHVIKCHDCEVPLTYHFKDDTLQCHHCGHKEEMVSECPKCHSRYLSKTGFGTEKVEQEVKRLFPDAKVARLDSDVGRLKNSIKNILDEFSAGNIDILIGTQMIAKGHDFENVTLVGIVLADLSLALPSYRAGEKTFSLITQAIGRAGRKNKLGEAIVQTNNPKNYAVYDASKQDYERFFNEEMVIRKLHQDPPFTYLSLLTLSSSNEQNLIDRTYEIITFLETKLNDKKVLILGPSTPFIAKLNNKFRRNILLKYKSYDEVKIVLEELMIIISKRNDLALNINVDPYDDY